MGNFPEGGVELGGLGLKLEPQYWECFMAVDVMGSFLN